MQRAEARTIDFAATEPQPGDEEPQPFSFLNDRLDIQQPVRRFLDGLGPLPEGSVRAHVACMVRQADGWLARLWTDERDSVLEAARNERANLAVAVARSRAFGDVTAWRLLVRALDHAQENRQRPADRLAILDEAPPSWRSDFFRR